MQHSNRHTVTAYIPALILCYSAQFTDSVTMPVILTSPCEWAGALGTCTVAMATADSLCNVWAHYHIHKKLDPLGTFHVSAIIDIIDLHAQAKQQNKQGVVRLYSFNAWDDIRFLFSFSRLMASIHCCLSSADLAISTNHLFLATLCTFQLLFTMMPLV